jgi:uncharacterized protein
MKWQDGQRSENIEDRRGQAGPRSASFPGGGGKLGGFGMIVVVILALLFGFDPTALLGGMQQPGQEVVNPASDAAPPVTSQQEEQLKAFVSVVLAETETTWSKIFASAGEQYPPPTLVLYRDRTQTACGMGAAAAGPFYCPGDRKVYLDLSFIGQLQREFNAPGDFAVAYVIAHEVGHHIQTITGTERQVRAAQQRAGSKAEANAVQVAMELQADCYAGLWAHDAQNSRQILEPGDLDEALRAAQAVGDDTIMKRTQGYVVPDAFTHGSAEQRKAWFLRGYQSGSYEACDTFGDR